MKWAEGVKRGFKKKVALGLGFEDGEDFTKWRLIGKDNLGHGDNVHRLTETSGVGVFSSWVSLNMD